MVLAAVGGSAAAAQAPVCTVARVSSSSPFRLAVLRLGVGVSSKNFKDASGVRMPDTARRAYALASDTTGTTSDIRSADLNDMCTLQLGMLYQLLARTGNGYSSMRCTVYARNFTAVGPGEVKLLRVAHFPVVPGQLDDPHAQQQSTLLLHTEQSWALQGGSAAVDPSAMIEECLLHREVVALPSSSALVFPLVDCAVLVGLLVVEQELELESEWEREASGTGVGARVVSTSGLETSLERAGGSGGHPVHGRTHRRLTDEELQCIRLAVPLLSKACGMDARASWQLAQSSMGAAAARGVLREAQRPLSTLNTFSAMLIPRLKDGDPDKDMAKGILLQGKRLQDLLWQLEDALHGSASSSSASTAAGAGMTSSIPVAVPGVGSPHPPVMAAPPFRTPSALPRDPSPAVQELLQLPQPRPAALPAGSKQPGASDLGAEAGPVLAEAGAVRPGDTTPGGGPSSGAGPPAVLPGRVTFVERVPPDATSSAAQDGGGVINAFTIRQPPLGAGGSSMDAAALTSGGLTPSPVVRPSARPYAARVVAPVVQQQQQQQSPTLTTIDVEMDTCEPVGHQGSSSSSASPSERSLVAAGSSASGSASGSSWSLAAPQLGNAGGNLAALISTNIVSALAGVLTAACKLAAVSGIGFIVNTPLSAVLPRRNAAAGGGTGARGRSAPSAGTGGKAAARRRGLVGNEAEAEGGAASAGSLAAGPGPRLIPRPVRPLLVGVQAALVQKVVGYMLDIALQCTPRGGQVCVSARQDGAGVQVQVLHSGRMDLQRLHVRSRALGHSRVAAGLPLSSLSAPSSRGREALGRPGGGAVAAGVGAHAGAAVLAHPAASSTAAATAALAAGGGGGGVQAGSGVLTVEMAQELAQQAGGHLTVSYPFNMVNAQSGSLDVGTSVEIWLPGPGAGN